MSLDFLQLKVTRKETAATDAVIVYLEEINGRPILYEAGQFFTFIIHLQGRELRRSYSIVTTPGIDEGIAVIIKRLENGEISRYLIDHLQPGHVLTALKPSGRFTLTTNALNQRTVFFVTAGSGISPIFSLMKKLLHDELFSRAILIYQNRNEASIIFKDELEALQQRYLQRFLWIKLLSSPMNENSYPQRLNNYLMEQLVREHYSFQYPNDFYICGPGSFMRMAQFVLKLMGVKDENIRKENFVINAVPPPPVLADHSPKQIVLKWKDQLYRFSVSYPMNILQAALNNNIHLPYSCRGGRCSTCTIKCNKGKVKMSINEVLTERDLQQGLVLTCVGFAETDLELEV